jgi:hypothetical protein
MITRSVCVSGPGEAAVSVPGGGVYVIPLEGGGRITISGSHAVPGAVFELPGGGTYTIPWPNQEDSSAKPPRAQEPLKPCWVSAREAAFGFLEKNGLPRPDLRDGRQARLEDFIAQAVKAASGKTPVNSQVQRYRKRFLDEFIAKSEPLKAEAEAEAD